MAEDSRAYKVLARFRPFSRDIEFIKPDGRLVKKHYTAMHELDSGKACLYIIDKPKCSLLVLDQPVTVSRLYASQTGLNA